MNKNNYIFLKPKKKLEPFISNENYPNFEEFEKIQAQFLAELEKPLQSKKRKERQTELSVRMCHVFEQILTDPNVRVNTNELFLLLFGDFVKVHRHHFPILRKTDKTPKKPPSNEAG